MITRGTIIGKIVDDLSRLHAQIEMRSKLGLTDLNKYCEDFVRGVLNLAYDLSLSNLNTDRSNQPGLDLGDSKNKIAFQVTSTITSEKVNNTLEKITDDQLTEFDKIKIFILGKKQKSYTAIKDELKSRCSFSEKNILDFIDLLRTIVALEFDVLYELNELFKKEFQTVLIEIEMPDNEGKYPTSISDKLEVVPNTVCKNANLFLAEYKGFSLLDVNAVFNGLARLPRVTREFLEIIIRTGDESGQMHQVYYQELVRKLNIPTEQINQELRILENRGFVSVDEDDETISTRFNGAMADIVEFCSEGDSLRKVVVALDFRTLDG